MDSEEIITLINDTYQWFNKIADPTVPFDLKDLATRFEPDFIMQLNDNIITNDYDSLFDHFIQFRNSGTILNVILPLQEIMVSNDNDKCVARYNIDKIYTDKTTRNIKVIAIWHISENKRLQRMNEVVYFEEGAKEGIVTN